MQTTSLLNLLQAHVDLTADRDFLYAKKQGQYQALTYAQVAEQIDALAVWLLTAGINPGDRVALLSQNRPEWVICDFACQKIQAVLVPIYPTLTTTEIEYILTDSGASAVFCETHDHLSRLMTAQQHCPLVRHIVSFDAADAHGVMYLSFEEALEKGRKEKQAHWTVVLERQSQINRNTLVSIVYTSGTTGNPKGVMLSHGNFLSNIEDIMAITPVSSTDIALSFLPLSHVFERTVGYYVILAVGGKIYYAESINTVSIDIQEVRPTIVVSVPRLYEKIQAKILDEAHGLKEKILYWALKIGQRYQTAKKSNTLTLGLRIDNAIAKALVFRKIKAKVGGRLRFFVSGGAPLARDLGRFFENMGLIIIEGYGMTESGPVIACNRLDDYKFGTVGKALPSLEVGLNNEGELICKGENVMLGYWNLPEKTAEVIDEKGFLHTGDIAEIDSDGSIRIIDRKKEIIVLSNGKKIPPQNIEKALGTSKFIAQVVVIGEGHNFLTALVVPQWNRVRKAMGYSKETSEEQLSKESTVYAFMDRVIQKKLEPYANYEKIKKFVILAHELSPETGELTPTLKPKRKIIYEKFQADIEALYDDHSHTLEVSDDEN
ncbi:MAG: long-chain fatty acid--CoA ligase [Candidatus Margulisiibacteriota bacterium]